MRGKSYLLARLIRDQSGSVITSEVFFLAVIAVLGLLVALTAVRDSVVSELTDVSGSVQNTVQSYSVNGTSSDSANTFGMDFLDKTDNVDDTEDPIGAAGSGVLFNVSPSDELIPVSTDDLVVEILFNGDTSDTSPFGGSNDVVLQNGASVSGGQLVLDGDNDFATIPNSNDINTGGPFPERTIHIEFTPDNVIDRQLVFEEGGSIRGLNIYIDGGLLYFGGYNIPETGYAPTFLTAPITAGQTISAAIVLDGGASVGPDAFSAYVNGSLVGRTPGSQLFSHGGGIGIGAVNGRTVFHDGVGSGAFLDGSIDSLSIYNRALSDAEVNGL